VAQIESGWPKASCVCKTDRRFGSCSRCDFTRTWPGRPEAAAGDSATVLDVQTENSGRLV
jgi:hypothetical protein